MPTRRAKPASQRRVPAVTRAIAILRRLGAAPEPMGVNRLARELGLVPSTCLHILRVLADEGLVEFEPASKRYSIGIGILPIARAAIRRNGFAALAQPRLDDLSRTFDVTAMATQLLDARQMVVVALACAETPFRLAAELGSRFPALISATGRCVAAFGDLSDATLRARFARLQWDNPPDVADWMAEIAQTRRNGYAVDRGRYINGVTIVAVPFVAAGGGVSHSLVALGIGGNLPSPRVKQIAREMLRMRDEIAAALPGE